MSIDNWINLGVALGTIFLGIMAFLSIRQTRHIQKNEQRQRLLNEITEWARAGLRVFSDYLPVQSSNDRRETIWRLAEITAEKISRVTGAQIFGNDFLSAVNKAATDLEAYINWLKTPTGIKPEEADITKSFAMVLELASNLKAGHSTL